jgi:hypothetical protein
MISRSRSAITVAILTLCVFTMAVAMADELKINSRWTIFDVTGKKVGDVDSMGVLSLPAVYFRVGDFTFGLIVYRPRFQGNAGSDVFFETSDCSGTPFIRMLSTLIAVPVTTVARPGNTVYFAEPDATPQTITAMSRLPQGGGDGPAGPCTAADEVFSDAVPAIPLVDMDTHFTPPFIAR